MRAYVLATGDELVRGRTFDTNSPEIARALAEIGVGSAGSSTVGDDEEALADAILHAAEHAELIVVTGGLGPTLDDCTRGAAARAAGVALVRRADVEEELRLRYASRGLRMPESNLFQADVPEGAEVLPNRHGTAPGFRLRVRGAELFALPGPPHEMRGVLDEEALPRIRALAGVGRVVRTRVLETFGMREASLGEEIADLMERGREPRVGTTAVRGTIRVVVHAEGEPAEVEDAIARTEAEIRRRLADAVFGADGETLPQVVGRMLLARRTSIATAESCTGGLVAGALTEVAGISEVFRGGVVVYANEEKTRHLGVPAELIVRVGAVSEEVARAMASGARSRFGADLGVAVTGIAGPGGGTAEKPVGLVHLALDAKGELTHRRVHLPGDRTLVREMAVKTALDLVRRALTG
jgi:competence/damage-inducible protein CinA-like protein